MSRKCFNDLVNVNPRLERAWNTRALLAFYLSHGREGWISPVDDLIMVINQLERRLNQNCRETEEFARIKDVILDAMANAGRLCFCPAKFLRKIIRPLLSKHTSQSFNAARFEREIESMFNMFKCTASAINKAGAGDEARQVTVHYFFKYMAKPNLKIHNSNFYDASLCDRQTFVNEISRMWATVVSTRLGREIAMSYGRYFVDQLVKVEVPRLVLCGMSRLVSHIGFLQKRIHSNIRFASINSLKLAKQRRVFEDIYSRWPREADFLKMLMKHLNIVEELTDDEYGFWARYRRYIHMLVNGHLRTAQDIEFMADTLQVSSCRGGEEGELEYFTIKYLRLAKTPESRQEFLEFLEESPVLCAAFFKRWRRLDSFGKKRLIQQVEDMVDGYLYNTPELYTDPAGAGSTLDELLEDEKSWRDLETDIIVKLVRSSHLTNSRIREKLNNRWGERLPGIPAAYHANKTIQVTYRGYDVRTVGKDIKNREITVLKKKAACVCEAYEAAETETERSCIEQFLQWVMNSLKQLEEKRKTTAAQIEVLRQNTGALVERKVNKLEKKLSGLEKQMDHPKLMLSVFDTINRSRIPLQEKFDLCELALLIYSYEKSSRGRFLPVVISAIVAGLPDEMKLRKPYIYLEDMTGNEARYDLLTLQALLELFGGPSREYFSRVLRRYKDISREDLKDVFNRFLEGMGLKHLVNESHAVLVTFFHDAFRKYQNVKVISQEIDYLSEEMKRRSGTSKRSYSLVCARTAMDQFYGHVGENCTSMYPEEIRNQNFIPCRIVDDDSKTIEGYIHLLKVRFSGRDILVVPGIEPNVSLLTKVDVRDFYHQVRDALIEYGIESGASGIFFCRNCSATSNRSNLSQLMYRDMDHRGYATVHLNNHFPRRSGYTLGECVAIWINPEEAIFWKAQSEGGLKNLIGAPAAGRNARILAGPAVH